MIEWLIVGMLVFTAVINLYASTLKVDSRYFNLAAGLACAFIAVGWAVEAMK